MLEYKTSLLFFGTIYADPFLCFFVHVYTVGTVGFVGASYFVKKIYSTVKVD